MNKATPFMMASTVLFGVLSAVPSSARIQGEAEEEEKEKVETHIFQDKKVIRPGQCDGIGEGCVIHVLPNGRVIAIDL